jgi:hypothetical protein
MSIYFDKRNGLIIDQPHQSKKICPYCHINDDVKVDCKFIKFNNFTAIGVIILGNLDRTSNQKLGKGNRKIMRIRCSLLH